VKRSTGIGPDFDAVLDAAKAGKETAFEALYLELNPRLLRYFTYQAPGVAEDLASETWIGVARNLGSFTGGEDAFRGWVFQIADRRLVQHWRDLRRRPPAQADPEAMAGHPGGDDPAAETVASASALEAIRRITEVLSADQAQVVLLRVLGGLSVDQVAEVLDHRPGTVRVLQHRALRKLEKLDFLLADVTQ